MPSSAETNRLFVEKALKSVGWSLIANCSRVRLSGPDTSRKGEIENRLVYVCVVGSFGGESL